MNRILYVILIGLMVNQSASCMQKDIAKEDFHESDRKGTQRLTPPGEKLVQLEEGIKDDPSVVISISKVKKFKGYSARCGSIAVCTLTGALIGYGIVVGEFDSVIASALINIGTPILAGGAVGYGVGWGIGNYAKARITGRL